MVPGRDVARVALAVDFSILVKVVLVLRYLLDQVKNLGKKKKKEKSVSLDSLFLDLILRHLLRILEVLARLHSGCIDEYIYMIAMPIYANSLYHMTFINGPLFSMSMCAVSFRSSVLTAICFFLNS